MSQAPSTFGIMITSSTSPISVTSSVRSSSTQGLSRALTRVQSCVGPKSTSFATSTRPSRAAIFLSAGIASSRLPSRMSACFAMSGTFERIFSFEASRKWIIREGLKGISRTGSGASMANGLKNSRGFLMAKTLSAGLNPTPAGIRLDRNEVVAVNEAGVKVREASLDEVEPVLRCYEWLFAPPGDRPHSWDPEGARMAVIATIEHRDSVLLVADDDELVGLCSAYLDLHSVRFGPRCWVEDLAVHPDRRGEGIGKALLDAAKRWASGRGSTHLELDTSERRTDAQRFYEREGPSWRSISYS